METSNIPVLVAVPTEDPKIVKVWCIHCKIYHQHNATNGHRVAHCTVPDSPYKTTGYIIKLTDQYDEMAERLFLEHYDSLMPAQTTKAIAAALRAAVGEAVEEKDAAIRAAVAEEREACAVLVETHPLWPSRDRRNELADVIRARGRQ